MTRPELRGVDFVHRPSPGLGERPFRWTHMRGELSVGARGACLRVGQRRVPIRDARRGNPLVGPVTVVSAGPFGILRQPVAAARLKPAEVGVSGRSVASARGLKERHPRPEGLCGRRLVHAISGWWPSDPGLLRLCSQYSLSAFITRQFVTAGHSDEPLRIRGFTREGAVPGANFSAIATLREAPNAERKRAGIGPADRCVGNSPMWGWGRKTHKRPLPRAS